MTDTAPGSPSGPPAGVTDGSTARLLAVLQFADGLFPAGGFAHSFALETYTTAGIVGDVAGVAAFVRAHLEFAAGPADAVAAACAARAGVGGDLAACLRLDARLDAMKWVPESRGASLQMGRQTARVGTAVARDRLIDRLASAVDEGTTPGHHAVVFGAIVGRHGADAETCAAAYLYGTAALVVNAALRLISLGQVDAQRLLADVRPLIAGLAGQAARAQPEDLWSFSPGLELAGLGHAALERRLFRS